MPPTSARSRVMPAPMNSHPNTCPVMASDASHPIAAHPGARSRPCQGRSTTAAATAAAMVTSMSAWNRCPEPVPPDLDRKRYPA